MSELVSGVHIGNTASLTVVDDSVVVVVDDEVVEYD